MPSIPRLNILAVPPHPDDECLTGLLPLRLAEECGARVFVRAATYGSAPERRTARRRELCAACKTLGWRLLGRGAETADTGELAAWLRAHPGALVVCPHAGDGHPRHRATHWLAVGAADAVGVPVFFAETDYWMPCARPNLLVEASEAHLARLVAALRCHAGEIARSDYDRRLGAWMSDNVRRAGEFMAGAGAAPPRFPFATPYLFHLRRASRWHRLPLASSLIPTSSSSLSSFAASLVV